MPKQSIEESLTTLARINTHQLSETHKLALEAGLIHAEVIERIVDEDWAGLSRVGTRQIEFARQNLGGILHMRKQVSENEELARATDRQLAIGLERPKELFNDQDFVESMRRVLAEDGLSQSQVDEWFVREREAFSKLDDDSTLTERLKEVARDLSSRVTGLAMLALFGIECCWLDRFNRQAPGKGSRASVPERLAHWNEVLADEAKSIEKADRKAYDLLKAGDWSGMAAHAATIINEALSAHRAGAPLVDSAATLHKLRDRPLGEPSDRVKANELAAQCGGLIRRQLLSYAIAFRLAYVAAIGPDTSRGRAERERAQEDDFESRRPQGTPQSPSDLIANPDVSDCKMATVIGEVAELVTTMAKGKASSRFILSDPASDATINVFVPHIQIDRIGLVNGCAVQLVGLWKKCDDKSDRANTLYIERIDFTEQAKNCWLDYQTSQVQDFFEYLPHNLNIAWSWQAGVPGAANLVQYSAVWANAEKGDSCHPGTLAALM